LLIFEGKIQAWGFPSSSIGFAVVEAEGALDLLGKGNLFGDAINLIPEVLLSSNTS
jgi:hypothetical protein